MAKTFKVAKREVVVYFDEVTADSPEEALKIAEENAENDTFNEDIPYLEDRVVSVEWEDENGEIVRISNAPAERL